MNETTKPSDAQVPTEAAAPAVMSTLFADAAAVATKLADVAAKKTDRWWMSFLMLIGIAVLGLLLSWHRENQKALTELFTSTVRANTEALTKVAVTLERAERELTKREPVSRP